MSVISLSSPTFASARFASKSILKRPAALPLSPGAFPFVASFSINMHTPTSPKMDMTTIPLSPHVHFPTASTLASAFPVYSAGTYNRAAAIFVSPNTLKTSSYSDIEIIQSPLPTAEPVTLTSPPIASKPKTRAALRFQETLAKKSERKLLPRHGVKADSLPRSPYPSATPSKENVTPMSPIPRRLMSSATPHLGAMLSPVAELEAPVSAIEEDKLSIEFWQSVKLESGVTNSDGVKMMFGDRNGGLWTPGLHGPKEMMRDPMTDMRSPSFPVTPFIATGNNFGMSGFGMPLSPLPRAHLANVPVNVMSPRTTQFGMMKSSTGKALKSPAIEDPFAAFPSFSAVLMMDGATITA